MLYVGKLGCGCLGIFNALCHLLAAGFQHVSQRRVQKVPQCKQKHPEVDRVDEEEPPINAECCEDC